MPIIKSKKKSVKQSITRKAFNDRRRSDMKKVLKEIASLVAEGKYDEAKKLLPTAYKAIDKAKKRKVIEPNKASRKKSQVSRMTKVVK